MVNKSYTTWLFVLISKLSFGQVQITEKDIYTIGEYQINKATQNYLNTGKSGENQIWDFSGLENFQTEILTIAAYKNDGTTKDANITESMNGNIKDYYKKSINGIATVTGNLIGGFQNIGFMKFPLTYGQKQLDSSTNISYYLGKDVGQDSMDSVKVITRIYIKSEADAWGTLKIPKGDFDALRFKMDIRYTIWSEGKKGKLPYAEIPKSLLIDSFKYYQ